MGLIYCGLIWQWGPCCPLPPHPHFPKSANQVSLLLAPKSQPLLLALKESSPGSHRIVKRGKEKLTFARGRSQGPGPSTLGHIPISRRHLP